jgi:hypothetical protein
VALTLANAAARLMDEIKTMPADEARRRVNRSYRSNSYAHPWQHLLKRFTLQTEAIYNTGTITATNASTSVSGDSTVWVSSWVTSPSNRKITIEGRSEPYDVSAIGGATSLTLADSFIGDTDSGLAYTLYRDTYPLPTDCGMAKLMVLYDPDLRFRLDFYNQPKFIGVRASDPGLTGIPECFTAVGLTSETPPRPQIQLYPAPSAVRAYHGWYFKRPAFLTSDGSYFDWPEEYEDMIPLLAMIEYYETPLRRSPAMLSILKPKYADLFRRMKVEMDGNAAVTYEIEQVSLGRGGVWNPNPLSLRGSETVNWE